MAALLGGVAIAAPATSFGRPADQDQVTDAPSTGPTTGGSIAGATRGAVVPAAVRSNEHANEHAGQGSGNGRDTNTNAHGGRANHDGGTGRHVFGNGSDPGGPRDHVPDQGDVSTSAEGPPGPDDRAVSPDGPDPHADPARADGDTAQNGADGTANTEAGRAIVG
jgi:hypothetical protein